MSKHPEINSTWELTEDEDDFSGEFLIAARDDVNDLWFGWFFETDVVPGTYVKQSRPAAFEITWDEDAGHYRFKELVFLRAEDE